MQKTSLFAPLLTLSLPKRVGVIKFPVLEKIAPKASSLVKTADAIDLKTLEHGKKYYIGNIPIKQFLKNMACNKHIILCFSNLQKLEIAKEILSQLGIKNI
jgi:hypothetical protein